MIDLRRYPKTVKVLELYGSAFVEDKPRLTDQWQSASEPHRRITKKEHKERQEAVRKCGEQPDSTAFLGWVLLTDSWRHVRAEAVRSLARHNTDQSQALLALSLADRSQLVVRVGQEALKRQGSLPAFLAVAALWEDHGSHLDILLEALVTIAMRNPQPAMRQVLPRLEQEARRLLIFPKYRRRLREVILELDQATAHLKDLPLTAMASVESANLPLPADSIPPSMREGAEVRDERRRVGSAGWVRGSWQRLRRFFGS